MLVEYILICVSVFILIDFTGTKINILINPKIPSLPQNIIKITKQKCTPQKNQTNPQRNPQATKQTQAQYTKI